MAIHIPLILLFTVFFGFASATHLKGGENITINEPVDDDLYVAGGNVTINAPIRGDLIIAGGTVTVNDSVYADVLAAGGTVFLHGYVGDDVRAAGGQLEITGIIQDDLIIAGGSVRISRDATIHGDLIATGGSVMIDGDVMGNASITTGELNLNGTITGALMVKGGAITLHGRVNGPAQLAAGEITLGSGPIFYNEVRYWSGEDDDLDFSSALAPGATASMDESLKFEEPRWEYLGFASVLLALWYLAAVLVLIFIVHLLFGKALKRAAQTVKAETAKSVGYGFLILVGIPIAIVIAFVTVIGIPVAGLLMLGYLLLGLFASIVTSIVVANLFNQRSPESDWKRAKVVFISFGLFIVLKIITLIPVIGVIFMIALACAAYGAIAMNARMRSKI